MYNFPFNCDNIEVAGASPILFARLQRFTNLTIFTKNILRAKIRAPMLNDSEYVVKVQLRVGYLCCVRGPSGERIISFSSSVLANDLQNQNFYLLFTRHLHTKK